MADYHAQIAREIRQIVPGDERERADLADALAWVTSGVELCRLQKPATPPKHLVAYFLVIDDRDGEHVLLVDHCKAKRWLPSGGHVDPGEHPRETAARECQEELGVTLPFVLTSPLMITVTETVNMPDQHTDVSLWYVMRGDRQQTLAYDTREFSSIRWFGFNDIPTNRVEPRLRSALEKLRSISSLR